MPVFAAVDIGSNSVRLKIARLQGRKLTELHEDRAVTRLGELAFRTGYLSPDAMAETIKVLRRFHKTAQRLCGLFPDSDVRGAGSTAASRAARRSTQALSSG